MDLWENQMAFPSLLLMRITQQSRASKYTIYFSLRIDYRNVYFLFITTWHLNRFVFTMTFTKWQTVKKTHFIPAFLLEQFLQRLSALQRQQTTICEFEEAETVVIEAKSDLPRYLLKCNLNELLSNFTNYSYFRYFRHSDQTVLRP